MIGVDLLNSGAKVTIVQEFSVTVDIGDFNIDLLVETQDSIISQSDVVFWS